MVLSRREIFKKVPEITIFFWIIKLFTTAMGESSSDYLVFRINPYVAVSLGGIVLIGALGLQLASRRYNAWVYWLSVSMVAVFGTMVADVLHIQFGVPYAMSTIFFAAVLAIVFVVWQQTEKTLSIHSINSSRRELFYWATVLSTFALGTASGDLTATTFRLGYFSSALLFGGLILVPIIGYKVFKLNSILAFWAAYIITRPLGASIADWLGKPKTVGGLGIGDATVSFTLIILIIFVVGYVSKRRLDINQAV